MSNPYIGEIIDFHCHIASEDCFPRSFLEGVIDNITGNLCSKGMDISRSKVSKLHNSTLQDDYCDQLVSEMDKAGISKSVLLIPDFTYALKDSRLSIAELIDHHKQVLDRHPGRFYAFAGVDPRWGKDGLNLFEKSIVEYGFHGMKLYPPCGYTPAHESLMPYYELCSEYSLPVLVHIGATSPALSFDEARPIYLDQVARKFPKVDFILAHGSVHYPDECAMMCANRPNVYLDVSGFELQELGEIRKVFERGINHKVLFGTDWPIFRLQGRQKDFVDRLKNGDEVFPAKYSNLDKELFFYKNAARILGRKKLTNPRSNAQHVQ